MQEQDKRAVDSMGRCGLDLESVINVFPSISSEVIVAIYKSVRDRDTDANGEFSISINCS